MRFPSLSKHFSLQHLISRVAGVAASSTLLAPPLIWLLRKGYGISLEEAAEQDPRAYATLNAFFTRGLKEGARPMPEDSDVLACPVDGRLMCFGRLVLNRLIEAKGQNYSLPRLLGDEATAERLQDGYFANIYLSPPDYHRVHMPFDGYLFSWTSIPGSLFSVSPATSERISDLHCRNERLVCQFETMYGLLVVVFIGAKMVGSIETNFNPPPTPYGEFQSTVTNGPDYARGDQLGQFKFGSTVVICWQYSNFSFWRNLESGMRVQVGSPLGEFHGGFHVMKPIDSA